MAGLLFIPFVFPRGEWWWAPMAEGSSACVVTDGAIWSGTCTIADMDEVIVPTNTTLTLSPGAKIVFGNNARLTVLGQMTARGTMENPVVFDGNDSLYRVVVEDGGVLRLENALVKGGGLSQNYSYAPKPGTKFGWQSWFPVAEAFMFVPSFGAINVNPGGRLDAEEVMFRENAVAVAAYDSAQVKIWRSQFLANTQDIISDIPAQNFDARYDWWGSESGPKRDGSGNFEKIGGYGEVNVADWATEVYQKDPVIIVPGIFGSWAWSNLNDIKLEPAFHTYDDLIATFEENSYTLNKNLFPFPYNWRASNVDSAQLLADKVDEVKAITHWPKVDIVAHSMGGIVAREAIAADDLGSSIDQLILLGTPNQGAPKGYLIWDGGTLSQKHFDLAEGIFERALLLEAEENGFSSLFDYVRQGPILSARELLPIDDYLRDAESGQWRRYFADSYPRNTLLETLNSAESVAKLAAVQVTNVVGDTGAAGTLESFRVGRPSVHLLDDHAPAMVWEHGEPDGYAAVTGDHGLVWGRGDGTVPDASARAVAADETVEVAAGHSDLPSEARTQVYRALTGIAPAHAIHEVTKVDIILGFFVHSPVDIQVVAPDGKRVGSALAGGGTINEIPGAFYTGSDTKTEFVTIPNPQAGTYTVRTIGTAAGSFRVESVVIAQPAGSTGVTTSTVNLTGTTTLNQQQSFSVVVKANQTVALPEAVQSASGTPASGSDVSSAVTPAVSAQTSDDGDGSGGHGRKKKHTASSQQENAASTKVTSVGGVWTDLPGEHGWSESRSAVSGENDTQSGVDTASSENEARTVSLFGMSMSIWFVGGILILIAFVASLVWWRRNQLQAVR